MGDNFYKILGVDEKASQDEIKKAYRSLSLQHHPDRNPGNPEAKGKFQKVSEAYETLGNEQKRHEYDEMKNNPFMRMNPGGPGGMEVPMDDIFNMFFGGGGGPFGGMPGFSGGQQGFPPGFPPGFPQGFPPGGKFHIFHGGPMGFQQAIQKPSPIVKNIIISMEQVLNGGTFPLDIERWILENGNKVFEHETIYIDIPQGVDDGELVVVRDKGNVVNENIKGDIKVFVKVNNESIFRREGLDLIIEKNISLKEALCGFTFEINFLNGKTYTLNNNKGNIIQPEYRKVYPNMGLTRGEHKGKLIIHFHIDFPETLTDAKIEKLNQIL
jgi:DnaJ-class molecular chaperone